MATSHDHKKFLRELQNSIDHLYEGEHGLTRDRYELNLATTLSATELKKAMEAEDERLRAKFADGEKEKLKRWGQLPPR